MAVKVKQEQKGKILVKVIKTGLDSAIRAAGEQRGKFLYWSRIVECTLPGGEVLRLYAQGYKPGEEESRFCDNLIYPDEMNERAFCALNPHLKKTDDVERLRLGRLFLDHDVIYVNPELFLKGPVVNLDEKKPRVFFVEKEKPKVDKFTAALRNAGRKMAKEA